MKMIAVLLFVIVHCVVAESPDLSLPGYIDPAVVCLSGDSRTPVAAPVNDTTSVSLDKTEKITPRADTGTGGRILSIHPEIIPGKRYFKSFFADVKPIFSAPCQWRPAQWAAFSTGVMSIAGLYWADNYIHDVIQRHQNRGLDGVAVFGEHCGNGLYLVPALSLAYTAGHLFHLDKPRILALYALEAMAWSGITSYTLKQLSHRHRPTSGDGSKEWDGPGLSAGNVSFPSGHTTTAFSVATIFASVYRDHPVVGVIAYMVATVTAVSRVYNDEHWASDVAAGAMLGFCTAQSIANAHGLGEKKVSVCSGIIDDKPGIMVVFSR
jgi:membrane-associated phospholipid phosphatase